MSSGDSRCSGSEIIEIADDASGDYVTTSEGKRIVDHENIQRSRLRVDARKWAAARLAPRKYGDHISHEVKGPGANFQPAILITVDGQPHDEFARQLAYDEDGGVLLDGNGDIVRARLAGISLSKGAMRVQFSGSVQRSSLNKFHVCAVCAQTFLCEM